MVWFVCLFCFDCLLCFLFCCCFVASDFLTTICHLAIINVCVSIGNTQISILLLCFLYLFVEFMITMNVFKPRTLYYNCTNNIYLQIHLLLWGNVNH